MRTRARSAHDALALRPAELSYHPFFHFSNWAIFEEHRPFKASRALGRRKESIFCRRSLCRPPTRLPQPLNKKPQETSSRRAAEPRGSGKRADAQSLLLVDARRERCLDARPQRAGLLPQARKLLPQTLADVRLPPQKRHLPASRVALRCSWSLSRSVCADFQTCTSTSMRLPKTEQRQSWLHHDLRSWLIQKSHLFSHSPHLSTQS